MKKNDFIYKLQNVIKGWLFFFIIWIIITVVQVVFISNFSGYSGLFEKFKGMKASEAFVSWFCLIFYCSWWIVEIIKYFGLKKEYQEFIKNLDKTPEVKKAVYKLKILSTIIIIVTFLSILFGCKNNVNCSIVILGFILKLWCIVKFKHLMDLIAITDLNKYKKLET